MGTSRSVVEAIDRLGLLPGKSTGPYEEVLLFNCSVTITLEKDPKSGQQYFSSKGSLHGGSLFDLSGRALPGSDVKTALPTLVTKATAPYLLTFPEEQPGPYDILPVKTGPGQPPAGEIPPGSYTKQFYDFGKGDTLVTEGPAFPKLTYLKEGGAQFWVGFIGAITQGTGKYAGAKGMGSFNGSAYFAFFPPPDEFPDILLTLEKGFPANVAVCIKVIAGDHLAGGS